MKMKTTKGFTLTELLIVMAIIVVLAAVAIPTFGKQLETSRETGDMEIIRNAYTEALTIAALDAEDGKLNGKIGNSLVDASTDATPAAITGTTSKTVAPPEDKEDGQEATTIMWGAVWWAGAGSQSFKDPADAANATTQATGKYVVKLHKNRSGTDSNPDSMNNAFFSQNTTSKEWKYVSNQLMGVTVPQVDTTYDFVVFEFYIKSDGAVALVPDATAGTALAISVATVTS